MQARVVSLGTRAVSTVGLPEVPSEATPSPPDLTTGAGAEDSQRTTLAFISFLSKSCLFY